MSDGALTVIRTSPRNVLRIRVICDVRSFEISCSEPEVSEMEWTFDNSLLAPTVDLSFTHMIFGEIFSKQEISLGNLCWTIRHFQGL